MKNLLLLVLLAAPFSGFTQPTLNECIRMIQDDLRANEKALREEARALNKAKTLPVELPNNNPEPTGFVEVKINPLTGDYVPEVSLTVPLETAEVKPELKECRELYGIDG